MDTKFLQLRNKYLIISTNQNLTIYNVGPFPRNPLASLCPAGRITSGPHIPKGSVLRLPQNWNVAALLAATFLITTELEQVFQVFLQGLLLHEQVLGWTA